MKNVNRKKQLFFDFGRDYEANLDNFFFSSKNKHLESELENFLNGAENQNVFLIFYYDVAELILHQNFVFLRY